MTHWLLSLELIDNPWLTIVPRMLLIVLLVVVAATAPRRVRRVAVGGLIGGGAVAGVALVLQQLQAFDGPLPGLALFWGACAGVGCGAAAVGLAAAPAARRVAAVLLIVASVVTGFIGVNRAYGITHTPAALLGVQAWDVEALPPLGTDAAVADDAPLYTTWHAPAGMPAQGRVSALSGSQRIPVGGFASARDGALYLPPAALVADPPTLPLLVFMMGQPGSPDPGPLAQALDRFAAAHNGLAPIALVVDQLGAPERDPACRDSKTFGAVSTYVNQLVPAYAAAHLNIASDHSLWAIGGYSNGGSCALSYAADDPALWGQLLDVSGNEYPGSEHVAETVRDVFGGDQKAFDAAVPTAVMQRQAGAYAGHTAVFTWGGDDGVFGPGQQRNATAAQAAGFEVFTTVIPGAGHVGAALTSGLDAAISQIAPALGLAAPAS